MIVHKSLFGAGRLGARRRSAPTTRLGACSYTCRARGAQALRCYKPPHGGKTTRGRAFVVGIGHPRRELSPGRWYRASHGAIYKVVARCTPMLCSRRRKEDAFLVPRAVTLAISDRHTTRGNEWRDWKMCSWSWNFEKFDPSELCFRSRRSAICDQRRNGDLSVLVFARTFGSTNTRASARAWTMSPPWERCCTELKSRRVGCSRWFYSTPIGAHTGIRVHAYGKTVWENKSCGRPKASLSLILIFTGRPVGP